MPVYSIIDRWTLNTLTAVEAGTWSRAVELAVRQGVSLMYADLRKVPLSSSFLQRADLRGADLSDAELDGAYLHQANLRGADLNGARCARAWLRNADLRDTDLRQADLSGADLSGARLVGADLRGVLLDGACLTGAILDWRWGIVAAELLRQHAGSRIGADAVIFDLVFNSDLKPFAWLRVLNCHREHADWVLGVLGASIRAGDNAPELLRRLAADAAPGVEQLTGTMTAAVGLAVAAVEPRSGNPEPEPEPDRPATRRVFWTRRHGATLARSANLKTV